MAHQSATATTETKEAQPIAALNDGQSLSELKAELEASGLIPVCEIDTYLDMVAHCDDTATRFIAGEGGCTESFRYHKHVGEFQANTMRPKLTPVNTFPFR